MGLDDDIKLPTACMCVVKIVTNELFRKVCPCVGVSLYCSESIIANGEYHCYKSAEGCLTARQGERESGREKRYIQ